MKLANRWNVIRYSLYTPIYDLVAGAFAPYRKHSIQQLNLQSGERVLLIGAGTGLDLRFLSDDIQITATDITPAMLSLLQLRAQKKPNIQIACMDGQKLTYADASFDAVILHLILAVIPDPVACLLEAERVLKPQGRMVIFDKFLAENQQPSLPRKMLGGLTRFLFSDINRKFSPILATTNLQLVHNTAAAFKGVFRYILLKKP